MGYDPGSQKGDAARDRAAAAIIRSEDNDDDCGIAVTYNEGVIIIDAWFDSCCAIDPIEMPIDEFLSKLGVKR